LKGAVTVKNFESDQEVLLYVGHLGIGSNALSLLKGFDKIIANTKFIDTQYFDSPPRISIRRVFNRFSPSVYAIFSTMIVTVLVKRRLRNDKPMVMFVYKGNWLSKSVLEKFPGLKVHFHPDDSSQEVNRTNIFDAAEGSYDMHFTTRIENVTEIEARTLRPAFKTTFAYDKNWHFRESIIYFDGNEPKLGFIGHARQDRTKLILEIAKTYQKSFFISGLKWNRMKELKKFANVLTPRYQVSFSSLVAEVPLQLGLLNSANRDQHTARSYEIPAAGGLILAEDTIEHREIFDSENNALFFRTKTELFEKIDWVFKNPLLATKIADNGYLHITAGKNSWDDRAEEFWSAIVQFINK